MNVRIPILIALCFTATLASTLTATAQVAPIEVERFGLYVVTDDLSRAADFYQRVFGKPKVRVPGMVGFAVGGGLYAIVGRNRFATTAVRGDTMRGYIKVANTQATYKLLAGIIPGNIEDGVVTEGSFSFFRVRDPDGNLIKFYAGKA